MHWYWWVWIGIVVFLVLLPLGYGWGYRGWGPPYPRTYVRRRRVAGPVRPPPHEPRPSERDRGARRSSDRPPGTIEQVEIVQEVPVDEEPPHQGGWGIAADLLWLAVLGAALWAIVAGSFGG